MSELAEPPTTGSEATVHESHLGHETCMTLRASIQWDEPGSGAGGLRHLQSGSEAPELTVHQSRTPPSALLKIRIPVERRTRGPKIKHTLFLLISPDIIGNVTLSQDSDNWAPQIPAGGAVSGCDAPRVCLLFELTSRADLIGPPKSMLPAHRSQRAALDSVGLFAQQLVFRIFVTIDNAQKHELTRLCQALSKHELGPIDPSSQIAGFYRGQGSQRLDPECGLYNYYDPVPSASRTGEGLEALPSYDELGSTPTAPPPFPDDSSKHSGASYKRKRESDAMDQTAVEALCRKIVAEEHSRIQETLRVGMSRMKEQLCGQYLPDEFSKMETRIGERLEKKIDDEISQLRKELSDQHEDLENQINDLDTQVDERIWYEIDERLTGERVYLEDFVKEQLEEAMESAEENLKDTIRKASFSIEFND